MADEEVTDLTGEEEQQAAPGEDDKKDKKEKAPKAPKEPKEKKEKEPKNPDEKKKGGTGGIVLVMVMIALLLLGSFFAAMILNLFGVRAMTAEYVNEPLIKLIVWLDPRFHSIDEALREIAQAREDDLNEWEAELAIREEEVTLREGIADTREAQQERRANDLDRQEQEFREMYERAIPLYRREMTPEELEEMISYAKTFTRMSPEEAAEILINVHSLQDVASILFYLSERERAPILAVFHPEYAASVVDFWIYN